MKLKLFVILACLSIASTALAGRTTSITRLLTSRLGDRATSVVTRQSLEQTARLTVSQKRALFAASLEGVENPDTASLVERILDIVERDSGGIEQVVAEKEMVSIEELLFKEEIKIAKDSGSEEKGETLSFYVTNGVSRGIFINAKDVKSYLSAKTEWTWHWQDKARIGLANNVLQDERSGFEIRKSAWLYLNGENRRIISFTELDMGLWRLSKYFSPEERADIASVVIENTGTKMFRKRVQMALIYLWSHLPELFEKQVPSMGSSIAEVQTKLSDWIRFRDALIELGGDVHAHPLN